MKIVFPNAPDWAVSTDQYQFILEQRHFYGENSKNAGQEYWKAESFHPSLDQAMKKIITFEVLTADDVLSVEQVIEFMQRQESRIAAVTKTVEE